MLKFWRWLLVVIVVLVTACGGPLHDEVGYKCVDPMPVLRRGVMVDEKFTDLQVGHIKEAIFRWKRSTNGAIDYTIVGRFQHVAIESALPVYDGETVYIYYGDSSDAAGQTRDTLIGMANKNVIDIIMDRLLARGDPATRMIGATMHEIGHTIGIGHLPAEPDALMAPTCTTACVDPRLTVYDVGAFCSSAREKYRWGFETLSCEML